MSRVCTEIRTNRIREIYRRTKLQERHVRKQFGKKIYLMYNFKEKKQEKNRMYHIAPRVVAWATVPFYVVQ